jgi:hypothetical protein
MYFGNYRRVVLISQSTSETIVAQGRAAAERLGLEFEHRHVGLEPFTDSVTDLVAGVVGEAVAGVVGEAVADAVSVSLPRRVS